MTKEPMDQETFIKTYYDAHRRGLNTAELAKEMGVSRMAVVFRVERLRKNGVNIPGLAKSKFAKAGKRITAESFVRAWQTSESVEQVGKKLGLKNGRSLQRRADHFKKMGVPLKEMGINSIQALIALAKSLASKK